MKDGECRCSDVVPGRPCESHHNRWSDRSAGGCPRLRQTISNYSITHTMVLPDTRIDTFNKFKTCFSNLHVYYLSYNKLFPPLAYQQEAIFIAT